jgi:hypothetical protein
VLWCESAQKALLRADGTVHFHPTHETDCGDMYWDFLLFETQGFANFVARCKEMPALDVTRRAANYSLQPFAASLHRVKGLCDYVPTACDRVTRVVCIRLQP